MMSEINTNLYSAIAIVVVGMAAFFMGRASINIVSDSKGFNIEEIEIDKTALQEIAGVYASSRGTKYYPVWCSAHETLSDKNKISFTSASEAEANGYTIAKACAK